MMMRKPNIPAVGLALLAMAAAWMHSPQARAQEMFLVPTSTDLFEFETGSFDVYISADADVNQAFSFDLVVDTPGVIDLTSSTFYNPLVDFTGTVDDANRWQGVNEGTFSSQSNLGYTAVNVLDGPGAPPLGVGFDPTHDGTAGLDAEYNSTLDAYRIATFGFKALSQGQSGGTGTTTVSLVPGSLGIVNDGVSVADQLSFTPTQISSTRIPKETIYFEDFSDQAGKGWVGGQLDTEGDLSWSISGAAVGTADLFGVTEDERFRAQDTNGGGSSSIVEGRWITDTIDVSLFTELTVSMNVSSGGGLERSGSGLDEMSFGYILDGEEVTLRNWPGGPSGFVDRLDIPNGTELQIWIDAYNKANPEFYQWDNIHVEGNSLLATLFGDFNNDQSVDADDLGLVLQYWGDSATPGNPPTSDWINDFQITGPQIDADELGLVLQNWGDTAAVQANVTAITDATGLSESAVLALVPEPSTAALLMGAGGLTLIRRRRS